MSITNHFKGQKLTQDQHELLIELEYFLLTNSNSVFLLKGYAGTGKSFIMAGVTKYLKALDKQFVIIAPTGKAAKVIADKTNQQAKTIHRVIYSFYENDKEPTDEYILENPDDRYSFISTNNDAPDTLYIVDESSMVSDKFSTSEIGKFGSGYLLQDLLEYIDLTGNPKRKVIFIGDNAQLPPVRNIYSPALNKDVLQVVYKLKCHSFELTEVVRQKAESGVMKNAQSLREAMELESFVDFEFDVSSQDVCPLSHKKFMDKYFELCRGDIKQTDNLVVIARTNWAVNNYIYNIRAKLFAPAAPVQVNEKVMCVRNFQAGDNFISNGEFGRVINVLSEVECRSVEVKDKTLEGYKSTIVDLRFIDIEVEFKDDYGQPYLLTRKVLLNLMYQSGPRLEGILFQALYTDFRKRYFTIYKLDGVGYKTAQSIDPYWNFIHLKFGYAITCHKSQGSEWQHVFVDAYHNGKMSKDYRWLYTAITRTSDKLYINQ